MGMRKKRAQRIIIVVAALFIMINWFFPFSLISLKKSVVYNADNVIIDEYRSKLKHFHKGYELQSTQNDPTLNRIPFILSMFEQPWLLSKGDTNLSKDALDRMLVEVREAREVILLLSFEQDYNTSTKTYLKMLLDQTLSLEEEIRTVQQSNLHTRKTLDRQLSNLHVSHISNFLMLSAFFEEYTRSKKEA